MIFIISIIALIVLSIHLAVKFNRELEDTVPAATAVLILMLYLLAMVRELKLIGLVAVIYLILLGAYFFRILEDKRKTVLNDALKTLKNSTLPAVMITIAMVTVLTSGQIFTWWDDINYWSSDAKQMFFLNGFPGKYGNVSPEFGDYPPVTSLFKWLFLQLGGSVYKESLQFGGYFALNALLLLPLFGKIKKAKLPAALTAVGYVAVMLLPGVFNGIIYYGTPADITMGIVYGALLLAMTEDEGEEQLFYYGRIALYAAVLLLTKSIGFEWAAFAIVFYLLFCKKSKKMLWAILFSGAFYGSWLGFCLLNRRVAKLTGAGLKMATSGNFEAPANTFEKAIYFIKGLLFMPMHADSNITFDISTGMAVLLLFVLMCMMSFRKVLSREESKGLLVFLIITMILTYGIIFLAHISIFRTEEQYLDAYVMAVSIARYGAPFTLGSFYLLGGLLFERTGALENVKAGRLLAICTVAIVILTADYSGVYKHLWGYRQTAIENEAYNEDMVGEEGRILAATVVSDKRLWGKRVLVMRDGHEYYWVHNAYISKAASPVALVYDSFLAESDGALDMAQKIMANHAGFLYVEDEEKVSNDLFQPLLPEGETFEAGTIYKVIADGDSLSLTKF